VVSALAERLEGGRYIDVDIDRQKAARYGMTVGDVQLFVSSAIGGAMVGETVEGWRVTRLIFAIRRASATARRRLRQLPILTPGKQQITLGDVAKVRWFPGRRC
jgi:Cu(I)/Ag(I) efflux system membrane protein CusA/SilA